MKRSLVCLFLLFFSLTLQAQTPVKKKEMLGTWKLVKLERTNVMTADETSGVVFSESFLSTFSSEDSAKASKVMFDFIAKEFIGSSITYKADGSYVEELRLREESGKFKLSKKVGKITYTAANGTKEEMKISLVNGQLIIDSTDKPTGFIFTYSRI